MPVTAVYVNFVKADYKWSNESVEFFIEEVLKYPDEFKDNFLLAHDLQFIIKFVIINTIHILYKYENQLSKKVGKLLLMEYSKNIFDILSRVEN